MIVEMTIRNYRCFGPAPSAVLFQPGQTVAVIGVNNVGKSTLLRLFYELRNLFIDLSSVLSETGRLAVNRMIEIADAIGADVCSSAGKCSTGRFRIVMRKPHASRLAFFAR